MKPSLFNKLPCDVKCLIIDKVRQDNHKEVMKELTALIDEQKQEFRCFCHHCGCLLGFYYKNININLQECLYDPDCCNDCLMVISH
jgi:hypothetical protein